MMSAMVFITTVAATDDMAHTSHQNSQQRRSVSVAMMAMRAATATTHGSIVRHHSVPAKADMMAAPLCTDRSPSLR